MGLTFDLGCFVGCLCFCACTVTEGRSKFLGFGLGNGCCIVHFGFNVSGFADALGLYFGFVFCLLWVSSLV